MKQQVLFVILDGFADWEYAFLATALQGQILDRSCDYAVKTVSVSREPVRSIGGFRVLPDYTVEDAPADCAGIVLIGGTSWRTEAARGVLPLVEQAMAKGRVVGAICDATVFLGMNGLLNEKRHTSNTLEALTAAAAQQYSGQDRYVLDQAVRDGSLITANGTGYLEFTREMLTALEAYPSEYIESNYQYFKQGHIAMMKQMSQA